MNKIKQFILENDNFLITTHINADGDAYASSLAVAELLKKLKKKYKLIIPDKEKEIKYRFLPYFDSVIPWSEKLSTETFNAAIICDAPGKQRFPGPDKLLPTPDKCLKIDHHPGENGFAKLEIFDENASSASKLVYLLMKQFNGWMDKQIATLIYAGMSYDTGRFSYANTSAEDYGIASELLTYGIDVASINKKLFFSYDFEALKTIGFGLSHMTLYDEGNINIIFVPLERLGAVRPSNIEELAAYSVSVENVRVGVFIREVESGFFKISLRAADETPVNQIAEKFNGGGHKKAAGCRFKGTYNNLLHQLIPVIKEYF